MTEEQGLRERLDMEYQVNEQLRSWRQAWNLGDMKGIARTTRTLANILWSEFPENRRKEYNALNRKIERGLSIQDTYSADDWEDIREYGELPRERLRYLLRMLRIRNEQHFYGIYSSLSSIIMESCKRLGLTWEVTDSGHISHDKKKPISMGGNSSRGYTKTYTRRRGTGSA